MPHTEHLTPRRVARRHAASFFASPIAPAGVIRKAIAASLSVVLVCGLCPAAAIAADDTSTASGALTTATIANSQQQDVSTLSTQASSVKSAKKTTKKSAAYTIKKYSHYKKYTYSAAQWYYGKPTIKGSSAVVKKINKSLNARYKKSNNWKGIQQEAKQRNSSGYNNATFHYTTDTKATYNKKGLISFCYSWDWWMGGVHNSSDEGAVYSLKTGKKLKLTDVMSGSTAQIKKKIGNAIYKQYGSYTYERTVSKTPSYATGLGNTKISDINFYLKDGKVVVCFEPYAIYQGNFPMTFTFAGNY